MRFTHIIFDLDETLYPRRVGVLKEIDRRITRWMENTLELPSEEVARLRETYLRTYGTSLGGLMANHKVDVDDYLFFIHDLPIEDYIGPNPALDGMLSAIPLQKIIFTNATAAHARRVLRTLEIEEHFKRVVGIHEVDLHHKPIREGYERLLRMNDVQGPRCIMVEDRAVNLRPGKQLGMTTVLVNAEPEEWVDFAVEDILEVGRVVNQLLEMDDER